VSAICALATNISWFRPVRLTPLGRRAGFSKLSNIEQSVTIDKQSLHFCRYRREGDCTPNAFASGSKGTGYVKRRPKVRDLCETPLFAQFLCLPCEMRSLFLWGQAQIVHEVKL
jgi:hypothetical protein